jgi:type II secretory pathway pseudopilin PulG
MPSHSPRSPQGGFTYLGLIILVTVIGMVGAATLKIGALMQRAQAEEDLLDIGAAFSAALQSYAQATPQGQPLQPPSLQELLKDPRTPALRRHLRKIFADPVTGGTGWGIVYRAERAGVVAVYSLSQAKPLKIGNFDARFVGFDNKMHLSDWKFTAGAIAPVLPVLPVPVATAAPSMAPPALIQPAAAPPEAAAPPPELALPPPSPPDPPPAEPEEKAEDTTAPPAEPRKEF